MNVTAPRFRRPSPPVTGLVLLVAALAASAATPPPPSTQRAPNVKVRIVLVGDSTVNPGGGWGGEFATHLRDGAESIDMALNGRSSRSFIDEGAWKKALDLKPDWVFIQFGHNDQPDKGPERETDPDTTYREFLGRYVDDARAAGARPVLVTSMTRRHFTADGKIKSDLVAYVEAVKAVAAAKNVPLIDLHARSIELLDEMGPKASEEFDPPVKKGAKAADTPQGQPDKTHLSKKGQEAMGKLVAAEVKKTIPELAPYVE